MVKHVPMIFAVDYTDTGSFDTVQIPGVQCCFWLKSKFVLGQTEQGQIFGFQSL